MRTYFKALASIPFMLIGAALYVLLFTPEVITTHTETVTSSSHEVALLLIFCGLAAAAFAVMAADS